MGTAVTRRRRRVLAAVIVVLLVLLALVYHFEPRVKRFLKVDACLDHGGRWNYATEQCEH